MSSFLSTSENVLENIYKQVKQSIDAVLKREAKKFSYTFHPVERNLVDIDVPYIDKDGTEKVKTVKKAVPITNTRLTKVSAFSEGLGIFGDDHPFSHEDFRILGRTHLRESMMLNYCDPKDMPNIMSLMGTLRSEAEIKGRTTKTYAPTMLGQEKGSFIPVSESQKTENKNPDTSRLSSTKSKTQSES